jgi:hypothetical protein
MNLVQRWWFRFSGNERRAKRDRIAAQAPEVLRQKFDSLLADAIEKDSDTLLEWMDPKHSEEDRMRALIFWGYDTGVASATKMEEFLTAWIKEKMNEPYQG